VVSAHDPDLLDWAGLARLQTLVVLMGSQHLEEIIQRLQHQGCRSDWPVAVIRWAGQAQQQVWEGTLVSIRQVTRGQTLAPCVMVFGEVVKLRHYLVAPDPYSLPLQDKTVLITRASGQSSPFAQLLTAAGARVLELPALEIRPPSSWQGADRAIASLDQYDWLILTSANAVQGFLDRLLTQGKDLRALAGLQLAVVGSKTAAVLEQRGLRPDVIPPEFVADALLDHFPMPVAGQRLLFPRVESGGRDVLVQGFTAQGATVTEVAVYESGCPLVPDPTALAALAAGQVEVITFASSKTVTHTGQLLQQGLGADWLDYLRGVAIAAIGPQTAATCRQILGRVDIQPQDYTLEALTEALVTWASGSSA
jgi:uroporphyrinogen III methyltransferase/synthase